MANYEDGELLRQIWSEEYMRQRKIPDGSWVAFRDGKILSHSLDANDLLEKFSSDIAEGDTPIFAFAYFGHIQ